MTPNTDLRTAPTTDSPARPVAGPTLPWLPPVGAALGLGTAAMAGPVLLGEQPVFTAGGASLFADPTQALLRSWLSPQATAGVAVSTGAVAAVLGLAVPGRGDGRRRPVPALLAGAVAVTAGLGLLGMTAVMAVGYALALALPLLLLAVPLLGVAGRIAAAATAAAAGGRGRGRVMVALCCLVGLVLVAVVAGLYRADITAAQWWVSLVAQVVAEVGPLLWLLATSVAWAVLALGWARVEVTAAGGWVHRHRRGLTVAAALAPAPYVLARLSWLTPWPLLAPRGGHTLETVAMGTLLGAAAVVGAVLTLGLVQRWGERFPRWVPVLGARAVPVALAVVPGAFVAVALCAAAVPMPLAFAQTDGRLGLGSMVLLPFWAWGPLLALAVCGYALHRRAMAPGPAVAAGEPAA
ncbi:hypothetical protein [Ornithinicoccus halotolerans]|uniref:hypothetical protein n=1 Tax=Ornithinicoccus halotolerans TaxID=1748220 RepID=UPI001297D5D1|nr:hypothetical protein [Ornithinicoccus halotolerans]